MRVTLDSIAAQYRRGERLTMVTAYDYSSATLIEATDIPLILVGDSLGMVVQGRDSTLPVTLDDIVYHCRAVARGAHRPLIVADLPFLTYATEADALHSAGRLMRESGCRSVKLEGGREVAPTVARLTAAGIPVMGHLGFTPQSMHQIGVKVQAKAADTAIDLVRDALALQEAGAWAVVLELVPAELAELVTHTLDIPTIGIGAGPGCAGEVQVWHDILGLYRDHHPRHSRVFADVGGAVDAALREYDSQVRAGAFPTAANSARLDPQVLDTVRAHLRDAR